MALLEKLIRLDSKDCNFHFRDDSRRYLPPSIATRDLPFSLPSRSVHFKVAYPQTITGNNSNEGLLRQFWHHVWAHYFRRLEQEEMKRLQYVRSLFGDEVLYPVRHSLPASVCSVLTELSPLVAPEVISEIK